ncbi:WD40-repeat-containing domain protein [Kalaharituber pfeilii]|nr:WD40-repeat-containing domain protein [Kalaharituber pfeilii]
MTSSGSLACTLSDGSVAVLSIGSPDSEMISYKYKPHEAEAWTCEYSPDTRILYSGGDDSVLNAQDLTTQQHLWKDRKIHGAGITAIMARSDGNTLITGSYDDTLRIFDLRTRKVVQELNLGGGVWRLGIGDRNSIIASCMHAGARVVDIGQDGRSPTIVARFEEHESMNYGSDIHSDSPDTVVSCSFYDRRICIWNVKG